MGYAHLISLATHHETESFVSRTPSIEYWETNTPHEKIRAISNYLEDVRPVPPC
jgi:hypothetical protein